MDKIGHKYKVYLFFITALTLFAGCGFLSKLTKQEDKNLLVGRWQYRQLQYYFQKEGSSRKTFIRSDPQHATFIFGADGLLTDENGQMIRRYQLYNRELILRTMDSVPVILQNKVMRLNRHKLFFEQYRGKGAYKGKEGTYFVLFRLEK